MINFTRINSGALFTINEDCKLFRTNYCSFLNEQPVGMLLSGELVVYTNEYASGSFKSMIFNEFIEYTNVSVLSSLGPGWIEMHKSQPLQISIWHNALPLTSSL